jgi:hypothetical protein
MIKLRYVTRKWNDAKANEGERFANEGKWFVNEGMQWTNGEKLLAINGYNGEMKRCDEHLDGEWWVIEWMRKANERVWWANEWTRCSN